MGLKKAATAEPLREVVSRSPDRDLAGLGQQLRSDDPQQRRWAARDLAAHPASAELLGRALVGERDPRVRTALLSSLAALGTPAAAQALLPMLRSDDAALRNGAIESLAEMPAAVAPCVRALLSDTDADVRLFTVGLLGELRHADVPMWLLAVLRDEAQVNVVAAAIEAMAEVGTPEHVDAVRAAAARFADVPFIAFVASLACERLEAS